MDKKNIIIAVLAGLVILGSLWGSVGNRNSKVLRHELEQAEKNVASVEVVNSRSHDAVLTKTAELQKVLQLKDEQLTRARKELVSLRKANKSLEARLSERDAAVQKLVAQKDKLAAKTKSAASANLAVLQKKMAGLNNSLKQKDEQIANAQREAGKQVADLQKKIATLKSDFKQKNEQLVQEKSDAASAQAASLQKKIANLQEELKQKDEQIANLHKAMCKLTHPVVKKEAGAVPQEPVAGAEKAQQDRTNGGSDLEAAKAQIVGLVKIVEEKNANIEEISRELDRVKINMDVLLSKISEQQDALQEVEEENSELVKELTAKNEECADLQDQLQKAPLQ
jgi:chromosome segregation ATPase